MELTLDFGDYYQKVLTILKTPSKFLEKNKKEKGWKKAFGYFIVLAFISTLLSVVYGFVIFPILRPVLSTTLEGQLPEATAIQIVTAGLINYIYTIGGSFVMAFLFKYWLKLFGAEAKFDDSYRLLVYARTPNYIFSWLPIVNVFAAFYSLFILYKGILINYKLSKVKAALNIILAVFLMFVLSGFLFFIAQSS